MLFNCYQCGHLGFHQLCPTCGPDFQNDNVPIDPEYYPEFQYRSEGFIKDLFVRKKTEKELQSKLNVVLDKYRQFEEPYFVNYVHVTGAYAGELDKADESLEGAASDYSKLRLFHGVLLQLGFGELAEYPQLTSKLVRSTSFRLRYSDFVRTTSPHLFDRFELTLKSWIEDRGAAFRSDLPLLLYYLWKENLHQDELIFSGEEIPLVDDETLNNIKKRCEKIYLRVLVKRFRLTLEQFDDPSKFVTMYAVDGMSGYEFEDFLGKLLGTIGYDVQVTKRSGDQGADLFAEKFGQKIVIQAKNYSDNVGNSAVQQVLAAKTFYGCDEAMVVSNSFYTSSAKELAKSTSVKLIDRREFQKYLDEYNRTMMEAAALDPGPRVDIQQVGIMHHWPKPWSPACLCIRTMCLHS